MLRVSDILFGVRNLLLVSLCLLFASALLASLFDLTGLTYPANTITNLALWAAVLYGSFVTAKNLPKLDKVWLFGVIVGSTYALLVIAVMAAFYSLTGSLSGGRLVGLLPSIVFYAILGLGGAFVGSLAGGTRRDF